MWEKRLFAITSVASLVFASAARATSPHLLPSTSAARSSAVAIVAEAKSAEGEPAGLAGVSMKRPSVKAVRLSRSSGFAPESVAALNASEALHIPPTALAAYRNADRVMAETDPGCGVSWNLLAGIARVESMHPGGDATDIRGTAVEPVYGPALDGTRPGNNIAVRSNPHTGPMQLLAGTWVRYKSDSAGDGVADPQTLYDAALAAASYLCSGGLNLRDEKKLTTAVLRYHNSMLYARNVIGWAAAYGTGVVPANLPLVTGPRPLLDDAHLDNPEGLGPGLPMNARVLPLTDPLAQHPLMISGPPSAVRPTLPGDQLASAPEANCTVICIGANGGQ